MLKLLKRFMPPVTGWHVKQYEHEGSLYRFKADVFMQDGSILRIKEFHFTNHSRKYAYHWEDPLGNLLVRWDNADHWPEIPTHPHHKHIGEKHNVQPSFEPDLESVLMEIERRLVGK